MSRFGRFTRIAAAFAAVAIVATVAVGTVGAAPAKKADTTISGAGSTFVAPLIAQWIPAIGKAHGYTLQYSAIGSGGGIASITARDVDFGASDAPLSPDQFSSCNGCIQIPWALAATSVFYNIPGAKNLLRMDGSTLTNIYMGKITNWNDPAIAKLNPGVTLPDLKITVAHRSDGSGTTFNFSDYLSSVSSAWKNQVGRGTSLNWPTGVGGKGSSGVAAVVSQTPGAIGYADVAYALANHLNYFRMKNKSGVYAVPALRNINQAAQLDTVPASDGALSIVNPPKAKKFKNAYPISTYTYVIVPTTTSKAKELKIFISWAVTHGQSFGPKLVFQPLPLGVVKFDEKAIKQIHS
jgi:phosphate transport system substrate-binding protein